MSLSLFFLRGRTGKRRENVVEEGTKDRSKEKQRKRKKTSDFCFNRDQDKCALTDSVFICVCIIFQGENAVPNQAPLYILNKAQMVYHQATKHKD